MEWIPKKPTGTAVPLGIGVIDLPAFSRDALLALRSYELTLRQPDDESLITDIGDAIVSLPRDPIPIGHPLRTHLRPFLLRHSLLLREELAASSSDDEDMHLTDVADLLHSLNDQLAIPLVPDNEVHLSFSPPLSDVSAGQDGF